MCTQPTRAQLQLHGFSSEGQKHKAASLKAARGACMHHKLFCCKCVLTQVNFCVAWPCQRSMTLFVRGDGEAGNVPQLLRVGPSQTSDRSSNRHPITSTTRVRRTMKAEKIINVGAAPSFTTPSRTWGTSSRSHGLSKFSSPLRIALSWGSCPWRSSRVSSFTTWGCPSSSSPPRGPGCCRCPGPSSAAWCWPWWSAAAASHCRCSTPGSWWWSTSPHPCRSRCRGSWPSWARPAAAASASAWSRGTWCSGGRPVAGWPGRESSTLRRPLKHNHMEVLNGMRFPAEVKGSRSKSERL